MIGKRVKVVVDRPLGSYHPEHKDIYYPINYGYVEDVIAPDGEEQDAYIIGVDTALEVFVGKLIAIIQRYDAVEEKIQDLKPFRMISVHKKVKGQIQNM